MRHVYAAIMLCCLATTWTIANADEPANTPSAAETQSTSATANASHTDGAPSGPDAWRYKRYQGLWWYWLPTNQWVYWLDDKWVPYDQKTYGELQASRRGQIQQQQSRSYSNNGNWGQWGPIRYDRYGNPQYPYSQRTRGMKQLGPVPTPGGVRSLPGWGGER